MKKICFLTMVVALCTLCSCTSAHKRAERLVAEYQQKSDSVSQLLGMMDVTFTQEEKEYVEARAHIFKFETAARVADNWNLTSGEQYKQSALWAAHAEKIKVPLTEEQEMYLSRYTEKEMYEATVYVLKRWQELN